MTPDERVCVDVGDHPGFVTEHRPAPHVERAREELEWEAPWDDGPGPEEL